MWKKWGGSSMKRTIFGLILLNFLISCSGPSYFNSPSDFVGGNRAVAIETHCAKQAGANGSNKDSIMYKLCEQSFTNHYGK